MSHWLLSVPVWGERYLAIFERATMPALQVVIAELRAHQVQATLVIHTDERERVSRAVAGVCDIRFHDVPPNDRAFNSLSDAHRQVLTMAQPNERVCLLTADLVMARGSLLACENYFMNGRTKIIGCAGMRACEEELPPEAGMSGRALLAWGWEHRHPMTRECTWPEGTSYDLWRMYFEKDGQVACRLCLPHPVALLRDRRHLHFAPTIDVNLVSNYDTSEIVIITNPDELGLLELSPAGKEFLRTEPFYMRYRSFLPSIPTITHLTNPRQNWFFGHKIIIKGDGGDCGDHLVVERMLHGR